MMRRSLRTGSSNDSASSCSEGSRPLAMENSAATRCSREMSAWTCMGSRMSRDWNAMARRMACLIHQHAYVENLQPRPGSNFVAARMRPKDPSCVRSARPSPRPAYRLAMATTRRMFAATSVCRAARPTSSAARSRATELTLPARAHSAANSAESRSRRASSSENARVCVVARQRRPSVASSRAAGGSASAAARASTALENWRRGETRIARSTSSRTASSRVSSCAARPRRHSSLASRSRALRGTASRHRATMSALATMIGLAPRRRRWRGSGAAAALATTEAGSSTTGGDSAAARSSVDSARRCRCCAARPASTSFFRCDSSEPSSVISNRRSRTVDSRFVETAGRGGLRVGPLASRPCATTRLSAANHMSVRRRHGWDPVITI
mmetsp:Transcript_6910/g.22409  ORF Transcript_6910/g.22409 Transcript_6910/m.22409 type:complete len:385 (-) Transcript_6910:7-1161(-)